eukprot:281401_1
MPSDDVLTMGVTDTPGTWLYESLVCKYDLDNLLLSNVEGAQSNVLSVNYHLTRMLIQGQCFDEKSKPVPGLQLQLRNSTNVFDATIAMQTLGYWQLKANPGVWDLRLREGRTTEVMDIDANKTESDDALVIADDGGLKIKVVLNSFTRPPFRISTKHKPGMEKEELLPQLTEEQIEAEEEHRLKQRQERQKAEAKSNKPESEPEKGSTGLSMIDKIKASLFGAKEEEQIEAEEEHRLKQRQERQKAEAKSNKPESEPEKGSTGLSMIDKIKASLFGAKEEEEATTTPTTVSNEEGKKDAHSYVTSLFGMKKEQYETPTPQQRIDVKPDKDTTIHVMSVASGHLYERFLKYKM